VRTSKVAALFAATVVVGAACSGGGLSDSTIEQSDTTAVSTVADVDGNDNNQGGEADFCRSFGQLLDVDFATAGGVESARSVIEDVRARSPEPIAAAITTYTTDFEALLAAVEEAGYDRAAAQAPGFDDLAIQAITDWLDGGCTRLELVTATWNTDFDSRTIDLSELVVGLNTLADTRDQIRPIDDPEFESATSADEWLEGREPGILIDFDGDARFYPLQVMTVHEVVNDVVGRVSVAVTFCPLCNSGVVFDREVDGRVLRFGTSGLLRNSDLVMWDDITESLWQQITGEGIVGELAGTRLEFLPSSIVRWSDFAANFPDGQVLSRDPLFLPRYGTNGYVGYSSAPIPRNFQGDTDDRFPALERVVGVNIGETAKAYPFSVINQERSVNDELEGIPIVVLWGADDTADALDTPLIAEGQAIGTGVAYLRTVDGEVLTFSPDGESFVDAQTGTRWNILGHAVEGPLAGARLEPVIHRNEFWFAWAAFNTGSPVYGTS
jgi:hypothetical protein